jgi:hypothetical protein
MFYEVTVCSITSQTVFLENLKAHYFVICTCILEITEDESYKLKAKNETTSLFTRNQISSCKESFIHIEDVAPNEISLREATRKAFLVGGQGLY